MTLYRSSPCHRSCTMCHPHALSPPTQQTHLSKQNKEMDRNTQNATHSLVAFCVSRVRHPSCPCRRRDTSCRLLVLSVRCRWWTSLNITQCKKCKRSGYWIVKMSRVDSQ